MNSAPTAQFPSTFWTRLEESELLLVKGPDAGKFLQGQVTCDIRELDKGFTRLGAQCNLKGRILLSFRALQMNPEMIALRIPAPMLTQAQQNFGKYIVFSKAKLFSGKDEFHLFGVYGEHARDLAEKLFPVLPTNNESMIKHSGNFLIQLENNRYEFWIANSNSNKFVEQLSFLASTGSQSDWCLMDIQAGIANIYPQTYEVFTPQEINYQLVNAVNFRKGCYTGQEIVARLHYRGKLKRHMYRFSLASNELPLPGSSILNSITSQIAGKVVTAERVKPGEIEILASVLDENLDALTIDSSEQKLKQLPLPYAIPTTDEKTE